MILAASSRATSSKITLEAFSLRLARSHRPKTRSFASSPSRRDDGSQVVSDQIRSLMRSSAQPVALITTFLPPSAGKQDERLIHAATLSSFTSISLDPNLVSFSMRTPSKLSDSLAYQFSLRSRGEKKGEVDLVVNVLADTQAALAAAYAKPGTPPLEYQRRLAQGKGDVDHPLAKAGLLETKEPSLPIVKGCVGSFGCQVVEMLDLSRYSTDPTTAAHTKSILYVAKVIHTHLPHPSPNPLIYYKQKFTSLS